MHIDHLAQKLRYKGLSKNPHKASEHQHIGAIGVDGLCQRSIKTVPGFIGFVVDGFGLVLAALAVLSPLASGRLLMTAAPCHSVSRSCRRSRWFPYSSRGPRLNDNASFALGIKPHLDLTVTVADLANYPAINLLLFNNCIAASALAGVTITTIPTPQLKVRCISVVSTLPPACNH